MVISAWHRHNCKIYIFLLCFLFFRFIFNFYVLNVFIIITLNETIYNSPAFFTRFSHNRWLERRKLTRLYLSYGFNLFFLFFFYFLIFIFFHLYFIFYYYFTFWYLSFRSTIYYLRFTFLITL